MLSIILSGDSPLKRGRIVGKHALTMASDASTRLQKIVGAVFTRRGAMSAGSRGIFFFGEPHLPHRKPYGL